MTMIQLIFLDGRLSEFIKAAFFYASSYKQHALNLDKCTGFQPAKINPTRKITGIPDYRIYSGASLSGCQCGHSLPEDIKIGSIRLYRIGSRPYASN